MQTQAILLIALGISGIVLSFILLYKDKPKNKRKDKAQPWENENYLKGLNYLITQQPNKAIIEFTKLAKLNPDIVEVYMSLGNLYREQGEVERAIRLHQGIILRPNLDKQTICQARLCLGLDYQKAGLIDRAINTYRDIISEDSGHIPAHNQLQMLYEEENNWEHAYMTQRKILRLTKSKDQSILAFLQVQIGKDFYQKGDIKEALRRLKTAIQLDKKCSLAYLFLGDIRLAQEKFKSAVSVWE